MTDLEKRIVYLDSMEEKGLDILQLIFHYLQDESKAGRNVNLNLLLRKQYGGEVWSFPMYRDAKYQPPPKAWFPPPRDERICTFTSDVMWPCLQLSLMKITDAYSLQLGRSLVWGCPWY